MTRGSGAPQPTYSSVGIDFKRIFGGQKHEGALEESSSESANHDAKKPDNKFVSALKRFSAFAFRLKMLVW